MLRCMPVCETLLPGQQTCPAAPPVTAKAVLLRGQGAWSDRIVTSGAKALSKASQSTEADVASCARLQLTFSAVARDASGL